MQIDMGRHGAISLPKDFLGKLFDIHGDKAEPWLKTVHLRMAETLELFSASLDTTQPKLSYNLIRFATTSRGKPIVIKCGVPCEEFLQEAYATEALGRAAGPAVFRSDPGTGIIVMERISPGVSLNDAPPTMETDAGITRIAATLAKAIHDSVDPESVSAVLPDMRRWTRALDRVDRASLLWRSHEDAINHAIALRDRLLQDPDDAPAFLHGDLHHDNILSDTHRQWRPIDPKGVIGPRSFEIGAFLGNPSGIDNHPDIQELVRQRIAIWAEISGIEQERLREWGYVAAVLGATWSAEDHGDGWNSAIKIPRTLENLMST